ncbi:MAG: hypothetical protein R3E09_02320 [Novosphingobium sp.]
MNVGEAHANTQGSVTVSLSGKGETNRFLIDDEDTGSLAASVLVQPSLVIEDQTTRFDLSGSVRIDQYTKRYGSSETVTASMGARTKVGERTSLSGNADFSSSRDGFQDPLLSNAGDLLDPPATTIPETGFPDVTAAGRQGRIDRYAANAQVGHVFSPKDQAALGVNATLEDARNATGDDFSQLGVQLSYARKLSLHTSLLVGATFDLVDYRDQQIGDGRIVTSLIGVEHQFTANPSVTAQGGIVYTDIATLDGQRDKKTGVAINFSLCDRTSRRGICATAGRSALPTSFGGITTTSEIAVNFDQQIGRDGRFSATVQYTRSNGILNIGLPDENDLRETYFASARYSHKLSDRLRFFISPRYARREGNSNIRSESNYSAEVGISYRFGAR